MTEDVQRSFLGFMPRSLRLEFSGAFYHVMARGKHREAINDDDDDRHCGHEMARDASALAQLGQRQLRKFTGPASDRPYCPKPCNDGSLGQEMPPDPNGPTTLLRALTSRSVRGFRRPECPQSASPCPDLRSKCPDGELKCPDKDPKCPDEALKCPDFDSPSGTSGRKQRSVTTLLRAVCISLRLDFTLCK